MINRRGLLVTLALALLATAVAWGAVHWIAATNSDQPYSRIEDRLYVGRAVTKPPPGTTAVLNLCETEDTYRAEQHLWEPIDGISTPDMKWLARMVEFIDENRAAGRTTYVHCQVGVNRSGAVVVAYLMHEHGWTRGEAFAFAQAQRPEILPNSAMTEMLIEWETELQNRERAVAEVNGIK